VPLADLLDGGLRLSPATDLALRDQLAHHRGIRPGQWTGRERAIRPRAVPATRNAQLTGRHAHPGAGWLVVLGRSRPRAAATSLGLTCGLIRIGSGASAVGCGGSAQARPDPTERLRTTSRRTRKRVRGNPPRVQIPPPPPSLTRPNAGLAPSWAPAFLAVVSNVVSIGLD
jgi:hypothetical protein